MPGDHLEGAEHRLWYLVMCSGVHGMPVFVAFDLYNSPGVPDLKRTVDVSCDLEARAVGLLLYKLGCLECSWPL